VQAVDGWTVMLGMGVLLAYLLFRGSSTETIGVWVGNLLILAWKHRSELSKRPRLRPITRDVPRRKT
jgi:hypothetical protein